MVQLSENKRLSVPDRIGGEGKVGDVLNAMWYCRAYYPGRIKELEIVSKEHWKLLIDKKDPGIMTATRTV
jgi:hypothetical protein